MLFCNRSFLFGIGLLFLLSACGGGGGSGDVVKVYFSADDGTNGPELWKTDGSAAGTVLVKDINPTGSSFPGEFTQI